MPADDTADRRPVRRSFTGLRRSGGPGLGGPYPAMGPEPSGGPYEHGTRHHPARPAGQPPGPRPVLHRWGFPGAPALLGPTAGSGAVRRPGAARPGPLAGLGRGLALRGRAAGAAVRPPAPRGGAGGTGTPRPPGGGGPRRLYERARRAWDRPLTAYYLILGSGLLITLLGLVMVYSASMIYALQLSLPSTYFFRKQFLAVVLGTGLLLLASRMPGKLHRALSYPLLVGTVFLMVLVQVPGIGRAVKGNQNWIYLGGPFQLQPSEFAKLALILWGADLLARKQDKRLLSQWKHLLVPLVPVAFMLLGLIMLGGDMGTAIILTAILFGLLWLAGAPTRLFAGVFAITGLVAFVLIKTSENRLSRFACIGATDLGPEGECWQAVHGIYALASGGWFGSGLGASVEKWGQLPEPHTDFIFAITGEELGLAGTLSVLALFAALGYAGIRVAGRTEDPFVRYAAGGVTTWIAAQAVVNIGAVLGLLPIAGVPLPLFSYGGSALLPTMFAIGLLIAFAREDPAAKAALAMRRPGVRWKTMRRRVKKRPSGER
ncbi:putative lipid II flippase FtsW [Streptomyces sp. NPDC056244]|uniref:putative lipid II flippase FtsW n=1 Tax=Streptomyces sp. NPDC056244 TaxID=3345762 RepID=UPI0035D896CF